MNLNERFNILVQVAELSQKAGVLTLDEAVSAKDAIETIKKGEKLEESFAVLVGLCDAIQKRGVLTLHDAHLVFLTVDGINEEIENFKKGGQTETKPEQEPEQTVDAEFVSDEEGSSETTAKKNRRKK